MKAKDVKPGTTVKVASGGAAGREIQVIMQGGRDKVGVKDVKSGETSWVDADLEVK